jgi:hypothetical protein
MLKMSSTQSLREGDSENYYRHDGSTLFATANVEVLKSLLYSAIKQQFSYHSKLFKGLITPLPHLQ